MNKRQRKKRDKKDRKIQAFKKASAIVRVITEGAISSVKSFSENGDVELAEDILMMSRVQAGMIAVAPIPKFKKGGVIITPSTGEIITPPDLSGMNNG